MSKDLGEEEHAYIQDEIDENQRVHPPSRKKYEEELDKLILEIREREGELEQVKTAGSLNISDDLKNLKAEKNATINKRKQVDVELEKLKKIIPEKLCQLGQLESSLIYKSEEKINLAIQRLEHNLLVQHFKLAEEKKIVSEIDRLKRSKKTLVQYLALKQETAGIRDLQRHMREERDTYFHVVGKLNSDEDKLRKDSSAAKTTYSQLKLQIDELYENKRQMVANHKKQMEDYQIAKDKQRKGSWKKRDSYRKSHVADKRKQLFEVEKTQSEKYMSWCNSLIRVLGRYNNLAVQESSLDSISPSSSLEEPEPAEEIDDGQYVLFKKGGESQDFPLGTRRPSKKNRRPRKQTSFKKITLSSDMVQQLAELGLQAPNSVSDIAQAIESLKLKKVLLEKEQHSIEVASDAGISVTESTTCELSRQVSKTESYEGGLTSDPGDQVYVDLLRGCQEGPSDLPEGWETRGAVGGCEDLLDVLHLNSDADVKGDMCLCESQITVCDLRNYGVRVSDPDGSDPEAKEMNIQAKKDEQSELWFLEQSLKTSRDPQCVPLQPEIPSKQLRDALVITRDSESLDRNDCKLLPHNLKHMHAINQWGKGKKPTSLCISPVLTPAVHHGISSTLSPEFPALTPTAVSPRMVLSSSNKSVWNPLADDFLAASSLSPSLSPAVPHQTLAARLSNPSSTVSSNFPPSMSPTVPHQTLAARLSNPSSTTSSNLPSSTSPTVPHQTLAARLSNPSSTVSSSLPPRIFPTRPHQKLAARLSNPSSTTGIRLPPSTSPTRPHQTLAARLSNPSSALSVPGQVQHNSSKPNHFSQPAPIFDSSEFPPLSPSWRSSSLSARSSSGSSSHCEQLLQSFDQQPIVDAANQILSSDMSHQTHTQNAFLVQQSYSVPVNEELPNSQIILQKSNGSSPQAGTLLTMSQIPMLDKLSTEKWVESSVTFVNDFSPDQCKDSSTTLTESTDL